MKRVLIALITFLGVIAFMIVPVQITRAASKAWCESNADTVAIGDNAIFTCYGFAPSTHVWVYAVQPDGATEAWGDFKTSESGSVSFSFRTQWGTDGSAAVGYWTIVVEQLGLGKTVVAHAEGKVRVTGGKEGVSGATLWTDAAKYTKSEWITIHGSGFAPSEMVTLWYEYPNGDCSSFTYHDFPYFNSPGIRGYSSKFAGDKKASASGDISFDIVFFPSACEGEYHYVARGNVSGRGATTSAWLTGKAIVESASLKANKEVARGISDVIEFSGSGFMEGEHVSCWLRTPQNQVSAVTPIFEIYATNGGQISLSIYTGSYFSPYMYFSEGAIGEYAMTCRGDSSDATAIATFWIGSKPIESEGKETGGASPSTTITPAPPKPRVPVELPSP